MNGTKYKHALDLSSHSTVPIILIPTDCMLNNSSMFQRGQSLAWHWHCADWVQARMKHAGKAHSWNVLFWDDKFEHRISKRF